MYKFNVANKKGNIIKDQCKENIRMDIKSVKKNDGKAKEMERWYLEKVWRHLYTNREVFVQGCGCCLPACSVLKSWRWWRTISASWRLQWKEKMMMTYYICLRTISVLADEHWNCQTNGSPASRVVIDSLMPFSASKPSPFSAWCNSENSVPFFSPSKLSSMCSSSFLSGASTLGFRL